MHWRYYPLFVGVFVTYLVIEGEGFYQEKGKLAKAVKKGDVVNIPENVDHWHGLQPAAPSFILPITNYKGDKNVTWLQLVSKEEYNKVNKK